MWKILYCPSVANRDLRLSRAVDLERNSSSQESICKADWTRKKDN